MKVRLSDFEIKLIKNLAEKTFGDCEIYIFGSRLKNKKGGDIDIFIDPKDKSHLFNKKLKLSAKLENILEKPVDVIVSRNRSRAIEKEARKGVKL